MQHYTGLVTDRSGIVRGGVSVLIQTSAGSNATLYQADGVTAKSNPLVTDQYGRYSFSAANGNYTAISGGGSEDVTLFDPDQLSASSGAGIVGFLQSGTGAVARTVQDKARDFVSVKDFGAVGNGATDDTAAIQAAINAASNIYVPPGNYLISGLTINKNYFQMIGAGKYTTTLTMNSAAATAIHLGNSTNVSTIKLGSFSIAGGASNSGGIALGTSVYYAAYILLDEISVIGFASAGSDLGYGVSFNSCQEVEMRNFYTFGNRNNLYRPTGGFCTSTRVTGKTGYIGHATERGVYIRGYALDFYIQDGICEGNQLEGIYLSSDDSSTYSCLWVQNVYFEANGDAGSGAGGVIRVVGNATPNRHKVVIEGCNFRGNPNNLTLKNISLDQVVGYVGKNRIDPSQIVTTATCQVRFDSNRSDNNTDWFGAYKLLLGDISVTDMNGTIGNGNDQVNLVSSLTFPATQRPSVDANTLDDYEEGTWTPTVNGFTGSVSSASGEYQKIGNRVWFKITIIGTSLALAALNTGNVTLPIPVGSLSIAPVMDIAAQTNLGICYISTASGGLVFFPTFSAIANATLVVVGNYRSTT